MTDTAAARRRAALYALLGDLPDRHRPIAADVIATEERDGYVLETLLLDLNGIEPVPALYARPKGEVHRAPAVLYNHAHGGDYALGKREFVDGRGALQSPAYAKALTDLGYVALCIDSWNFGERQGRTESELFMEMLWYGRVLWGMMVYDSIRALDYLAARPEVDPTRLGTLGLSMGSTMAWWLAALDERVKVCVDICCLTDFQALIDAGGLGGHGIYYYVPGLLKHFTTAEINALIVPRPHLGLAGNLDPLTPAAGLDRIDAALRDVYAAAGAPDAWRMSRYDVQHVETPGMRAEVLAWLERWL